MASTATNQAVLPNEILQMIFANQFSTNCLRRHIAYKLQHSSPTDMANSVTGAQTTSSTSDDAARIRNEILQAMDAPERQHYRTNHNSPLALVGGLWHDNFRETERQWLIRHPMDYTEFKSFCDNPTWTRYEEITEIAIELCPKKAFYNVLPELHSWMQPERQFMENRLVYRSDSQNPSRRQRFVILQAKDLRMYEEISQLWIALLSRLPPQICSVKVIAKAPDAANMTMRPRNMTSGELREIERTLKRLPNRQVQVKMLYSNTVS